MENEPRASGRRRLAPLVLLAAGAALTLYLSSRAPREQHVRLAFGSAASAIQALDVAYVDAEGEATRTTRLAFGDAGAPRIVALDPSLPDGEYVLRLDAETPAGRRSATRRVKLGGGTTSVDLAGVLDDNRGPP